MFDLCIMLTVFRLVLTLNIEEEISEIRMIVKQQQMEILQLQNSNHFLIKENHSFKTAIRQLEEDNLLMRKDINLTIGSISSTEHSEFKHNEPLKRKRSTTGENDLQNSRRAPVVGPLDHVAFYAYMSKDDPSLLKHNQLVFDVVKINIGNGYLNNTGVFVAPSSGTYVFSWTLYTGNHGATYYDLMVNGEIYGSTLGETDDVPGDFDSDSGTVVVSLNTGDNVYFRSIIQTTAFILGRRSARTSFSGWKLY
ncbi:complement C1q-like protein 2 [Mytilus trossulus]|uniref:complement C1q-like protein 2 n=1 Tax=Mytilus trossulus TaxID=6551 RepID=UPI0030076BEA